MQEYNKLTQNFRDLIIEKCKFCQFDKYLEENPDFEFPEITENCVGFIVIPGLFGGFEYFLGEENGEPVLYAEQSSRMDRDSSDYLYYEVTEHGSKRLEGEEREAAHGKFWKMAKKQHEERGYLPDGSPSSYREKSKQATEVRTSRSHEGTLLPC